ncbi:Methyltransferase type 11 [Gammaproteobacteria bacterium]
MRRKCRMTRFTKQMKEWFSEFGRAYTDRNDFGLDGIEQLYVSQFGIGRRELNRMFLGDLARDRSILEVGCNVGNQLAFLAEMGFSRLAGVEVQNYALTRARERLPDALLVQGSALALPFPDDSFDLVFTSGVLIHIHPDHLPGVLAEIHRVSRNFIWGMEYFCATHTEIFYRGKRGLLWKAPFAALYQQNFSDLALIREQHFPYQGKIDNVDSMYLLSKSIDH